SFLRQLQQLPHRAPVARRHLYLYAEQSADFRCELRGAEAVGCVEVEHLVRQHELLGFRLQLPVGLRERIAGGGALQITDTEDEGLGMEAELLLDAALDLAGEPRRGFGAVEDDV